MIKDFRYNIFDLAEISGIENILSDPNLRGLNVTIPYKEKVQPYLGELSEEAVETGAVNCILVKDGKKKGFNTDVFGFEKTLLLHRKDFHRSALILGDGGAAKAVQFVLNKLNIPFLTVSRKSDLNFENITAEIVSENTLIIQCTPVGTFPEVENHLNFPFSGMTPNHLAIDLIYNPAETAFLRKSAENGAKTVNGLYMLEQQAEKAWEIWNF